MPDEPAPTEKKIKERERVDRFRHGFDWQHGPVLSQRQYENYGAYLAHQIEKLPRLKQKLEAHGDRTVAVFTRRFELLPLKPASSVLCLGARLGHEVMSFIGLGHFAVGNDLNPGENNPYVVTGDFHQLVFADHSVDCVYMNSVDHILDVPRFAGEVRRVLKPDGFFAAEIVQGYEEGFWAGEFEVIHWPTAQGFAEHFADVGGFAIESARNLADVGSPRWLQCVLRP